jgi:hypothetical protein
MFFRGGNAMVRLQGYMSTHEFEVRLIYICVKVQLMNDPPRMHWDTTFLNVGELCAAWWSNLILMYSKGLLVWARFSSIQKKSWNLRKAMYVIFFFLCSFSCSGWNGSRGICFPVRLNFITVSKYWRNLLAEVHSLFVRGINRREGDDSSESLILSAIACMLQSRKATDYGLGKRTTAYRHS